MFVGDKVKRIHGKESGVVTKIISEIEVEIETTDGFLIQVPKREWVVISPKEAKYFGQPKLPNEKELIANNGIYLAWSFENSLAPFYLINNTDFDLIYAFYEKKNDNNLELIKSEKLEHKEYHQIVTIDHGKSIKTKTWIIQYLILKRNLNKLPNLVEKEIHINKHLFKDKIEILPLLDKKGHCIQIDQNIQENTAKLIEQSLLDRKIVNNEFPKITSPPREVDLHIEKLTPFYAMLSPSEIFKIQINKFEDTLERAIACEMDEIIFIHGIGNGSLKNYIHKKLSKNPHVLSFQDGYEKLGRGVTKVKLKKNFIY
jgi:dsDNA-specific endonuclease/ATPase MutS2